MRLSCVVASVVLYLVSMILTTVFPHHFKLHMQVVDDERRNPVAFNFCQCILTYSYPVFGLPM